MKVFNIITALIILTCSSLSYAQTTKQFFVEGLQAPSWVERNGKKIALSPTTVLNEHDLVITGTTGKVWLEMADGAIVKLGNNAKMKVKSLAIYADENTADKKIEAGIDILVGAFRYTTSKLHQHLNQNWQRKVDIQLAQSAVLGIRGTDLWGQVKSETQFVVLLEGNINITPNDGSAPAVLDQALQIFKIENGTQLPISNVDMSAVQALAPETELDFGQGVQNSEGNTVLNLASTKSLNLAEQLVRELSKQGYSSMIKSIDINRAEWHRVSMSQIASVDDANSISNNLEDGINIISPWIQ